MTSSPAIQHSRFASSFIFSCRSPPVARILWGVKRWHGTPLRRMKAEREQVMVFLGPRRACDHLSVRKETSIRTLHYQRSSNVRYFIAVLMLLSSFGLPGCTETEVGQEVALCREAMKLNAKQLRVNQELRQRFIEGCALGGGGRTPNQWKCVIAEMKQGASYINATDKCFPE